MTTKTLPGTHAGDVINRDRWGRPLIVPPGGGKAEAYTRVSTLAKALDDMTTLMDWKARMAITGLARRDDLLALARSTDDRKTLNGVVKSALEAAQASRAANIGTAVHSFTEAVDLGDMKIEDVPADHRDMVADYRAALDRHGVQVVSAENFVVNDELKAAGTFDRLVLWNGRLVIADLKTGNAVKFLATSTALQIATYANSDFYDVDTATRSAMPVDVDTGLLIHLPQDGAGCQIYTLDLAQGYEMARLAYAVREARKVKLHEPLED